MSVWIFSPRSSPQSRVRLFCFPYAGGSASLLKSWASDLPESIEVYPVQLPGRENRLFDPPFNDMPSLIQALYQELCPYFDIPFAFWGHSLGALVAFELARKLLQEKAPASLVHLLVSGCVAPHLKDRAPRLHQLPDAEFWSAVGRLNGTPLAVLESAELRELLLPTLRADFTVSETYIWQSGPLLACPISAFGGLSDPEVSQEEIAAWREHTCGAFYQRMYLGDHFFINSARQAVLLALHQDLTTSLAAFHTAQRELIQR